MGYLPRSGRSLLRGHIVYAHRDEAGDIISYSGRDPRYEAKKLKWIKDGKPETKKPIKHRYVKGFHRGIELYGQHAQRLSEEVRQSLQQYGLIIVEGQNDVIRLGTLGIPAVGLMSSKATTEQIDKICRFTRQLADNRSLLLPDNDPEGQSGCKDLAWELLKRAVDVKLAWSPATTDLMQPEQLEDATILQRNY
jgi:DNA primase